MCRDSTAVKIKACTFRRRPVSASVMKPICAKSIWHSEPGSPSSTRRVVPRARNPHSSAAKRCNVRYGTDVPDRVSSTSIFTIDRPSFTHLAISVFRTVSRSHAAPCPFGRAGRTAAITAPISSSDNAAKPASRVSPAVCAAST